MTLLYSVRTPKDIIFRDEFTALEAENPHFQFQVTCTRADEADAWQGRREGSTPIGSPKEPEIFRQPFFTPAAYDPCRGNRVFDPRHAQATKEQIKLEKWG